MPADLYPLEKLNRLAAYIQSAPDRATAAAQAAQAKLDALNLEIARLDGATSSKRRLDDNEFVEESRELVEGVRDAVKEGEFAAVERGMTRGRLIISGCLLAAMMKKRRKNKEKAAPTPATVGGEAPVASGSGSKKEQETPVELAAVEETAEVPTVVEEDTEVVVEEKVTKGKGRARK